MKYSIGLVLVLFCNGVDMEKICPSLCVCTDRVTVECSYQYLQIVPKEINENIVFLNLSHNSLENLNNLKMPKLKSLDVGFNSLTYLPNELVYLLPDLELLNLTHNAVKYLPTKWPSNLKVLHLSYNYIKVVDLSDFIKLQNLQKLFLDFNYIHEIHFHSESSTVSSLELLTLKSNSLKELPMNFGKSFQHLRKLSLCNNSLSVISTEHFSSLHQLQYLDLSFNMLELVEPKSFQIPSLKFLFLNDNKLKSVPTEIPILEWLDISFNSISRLPESESSSNMYPHEMILFGGNPYICDCHLIWLKEFYDIREYLLNIIKVDVAKFIPVCQSPKSLMNIPWDKLDNSKLICETSSESDISEKSAVDIKPQSWIMKNVQIDISEIGETFIRLQWKLLETDANTFKYVTVCTYHPFGRKHLQKRSILNLNKGKYVFRNLEPGTPYIVCIRIVNTDKEFSNFDDSISVKDCHELITHHVIVYHNLWNNIIFWGSMFFIFVVIYYFSLLAKILAQFYNQVQCFRVETVTIEKKSQ